MQLNQITLPAFDLEASLRFYRLLGARPIVLAPHYARLECATGEATFSLHVVPTPAGAPAAGSGIVTCFEYADAAVLDSEVQRLVSAGLRFTQLPRDEPWLWREARLPDPAGNLLCLFHAGRHRRHPPWRVGDEAAGSPGA